METAAVGNVLDSGSGDDSWGGVEGVSDWEDLVEWKDSLEVLGRIRLRSRSAIVRVGTGLG